MGRLPNKLKQNPRLVQHVMSDGRASLALDFYLGRTEAPVYDDDGNPVLYTKGAMKGKPKYTVRHQRRREALNLYIWVVPRNHTTHRAGASAEQEHTSTRRKNPFRA